MYIYTRPSPFFKYNKSCTAVLCGYDKKLSLSILYNYTGNRYHFFLNYVMT